MSGEDWFAIEPLDSGTFAISEYKHWEETHSYLLCGTESALLIDTGLGVANIKQAVDALTSLPVMVAATHAHWDHIGGHRYFADWAVHEVEKDWLSVQFPIPLDVVKQNLMRKPCCFPKSFQLDKYEVFHGVPQRILHNGDCIHLGGRNLTVIHTPGHSPGHCCFYEPARKYLFSGDLVYSGCLDAFYPSTDPQQFFRSIEEVRALEVDRVWPGHHALHIPPQLISKIGDAFESLSHHGGLAQKRGIFDFGDFQIHI